MSQSTAKRRRKQFANGMKHLAKMGRPHYKKEQRQPKIVGKNQKV